MTADFDVTGWHERTRWILSINIYSLLHQETSVGEMLIFRQKKMRGKKDHLFSSRGPRLKTKTATCLFPLFPEQKLLIVEPKSRSFDYHPHKPPFRAIPKISGLFVMGSSHGACFIAVVIARICLPSSC